MLIISEPSEILIKTVPQDRLTFVGSPLIFIVLLSLMDWLIQQPRDGAGHTAVHGHRPPARTPPPTLPHRLQKMSLCWMYKNIYSNLHEPQQV